MKLLKGWKIRLLAGLAMATAGGQLDAQMMPGSPYSNAMGPQGPMTPVGYYQGGDAGAPVGDAQYAPAYVDASGASCDGVGCNGDGCNGECGPYGFGYGGYEGCGPNGCGPFGGRLAGGMGQGGMGSGQGCGPQCGPGCPCGTFGHGFLLNRYGEDRTDRFGRSFTGFRHNIRGWCSSKRGFLLPYGEGGVATQRWFDLSADAIFLSRSKGGSNFVFSREGISGTPALSANMADLDSYEPGLALQANLQTGPGSNLEILYFGLTDWDESAQVQSNGNLFSFISNFGTSPANGYDDSDRSQIHRLDYSSALHNGEINFRRRWSEPQGFWQGSFLGGVRYMDIDESARFTATGSPVNGVSGTGPRFLTYDVNTRNSLVGFQLGGDLWYNLLPGVKIGSELKGGIFNNRSSQDSSIFANSVSAGFNESAADNNVAYITQINAQLWYRLNHSWAFRTSYQFIYVDGVSLATDNFTPAPVSINNRPAPSISHDAEIAYQGFTFGAEYMW